MRQKYELGLMFLLALALAGVPAPSYGASRGWLGQLAADTWRCLALMVDSQTGLPFDTLQFPSDTAWCPQLSFRAHGFDFKSEAAQFSSKSAWVELPELGLALPSRHFVFSPRQPKDYAGFGLAFSACDCSSYSALAFWAQAATPCTLQLKLKDSTGAEKQHLVKVAAGLARYSVPLAEFAIDLHQVTTLTVGFDSSLGPANCQLAELVFESVPNSPGPFPLEHFTSATNVGLLLADVVAAYELGLCTRAQAEKLLEHTGKTLEKRPKWTGGENWLPEGTQGFCRTWFSPVNATPSPFDKWVCSLDLAHLEGGLLLAGAALKETECGRRLSALAAGMDWRAFVLPGEKRLSGGYHVEKGLSKTWTNWLLGSDGRLSVALAIATGAATPDFWQNLNRDYETRFGFRYLLPEFWHSNTGPPAWKSGGLFMQYIDGLWVKENPDSEIHRSAIACAQAQQRYAETLKAPVWGWSCCYDPKGAYLTGDPKHPVCDPIVTPHASALAIAAMPQAVEANLEALEALGARPAVGGASLGFRDSLDWRTLQVSDRYVFLDQSMLFLSIADYLLKGKVRAYFGETEIGRNLRRLLPDYAP